MTPPVVRDSLVLRSPDAMVAALPYLVGFTPRDSVTIVWIGGRRILLTQRLDLADWQADRRAWLAMMWTHPVADVADQIVALVSTTRDAPHGLIDDLAETASASGLDVRDILIVRGETWRSALCHDERCCPPEGRLLDPTVKAEVASEFTLMGSAPEADRDDLVRSLAPDAAAASDMRAVLGEESMAVPSRRRDRERWRDEAIRTSVALLLNDPGERRRPTTDDDADLRTAARLISGLTDTRVRDTILWELVAADPTRLHGALAVLTTGVRLAPEGFVAPVATAAAVVAWLVGDGARAAIAVDRAVADRPDYTLAELVTQSLRGGLPPAAWRSAMTSVSRDECRHGLTAPDRRAC